MTSIIMRESHESYCAYQWFYLKECLHSKTLQYFEGKFVLSFVQVC